MSNLLCMSHAASPAQLQLEYTETPDTQKKISKLKNTVIKPDREIIINKQKIY